MSPQSVADGDWALKCVFVVMPMPVINTLSLYEKGKRHLFCQESYRLDVIRTSNGLYNLFVYNVLLLICISFCFVLCVIVRLFVSILKRF